MNEPASSLGYAIFHGLEHDDYLNEIYEALLQNYFLQLFKVHDVASVGFDTEDALRFADLLSKSVLCDGISPFEHQQLFRASA